MRLLTHNQLICVRGGCVNNFPLQLELKQVEQLETELNADFIVHMLPNIDYKVLQAVSAQIGAASLPSPEQFPLITPENQEQHSELIQALHTALLDTHVQEGALVCSKCQRSYPIQSGIPNMRLREDEVHTE